MPRTFATRRTAVQPSSVRRLPHGSERQAQHDPARRGARGQLVPLPARGCGQLAHVRADHGDRGAAGARPRDLPRVVGARRAAGWARDGPLRPRAGDRGRFRGRVDRLLARRARNAHGLNRRRDRRHGAHGRGGRRCAARAHRRRRHVSAGATGARDRVRALRVCLRGDPRSGGVRSPLRRQGARAGGAHAPWLVAGRPGARRLRDQPLHPPRPEADRRAARRARRHAAGERRATERDPAPARRRAGDDRRAREPGRDGLDDEPHRLRGGRAQPPLTGGRLPDHRRACARHVRARALRRAPDRPDRPRRLPLLGPGVDGRFPAAG